MSKIKNNKNDTKISKTNKSNNSIQFLIEKSAKILKESNKETNEKNLKNLNNEENQEKLKSKLKFQNNTKNSISKNKKDDLKINILPIDYQPKNQFQDFKFKTIVHKLGHEHAEVYIYLPCSVNFDNKPVLQIFESLFLKYGGVLYDRLRDELGWVYGLQAYFQKDLQVCIIYLTCEIDLVEKIIKETEKVFSDWDKYFKLEKFQELTEITRKKMDISQDSLGASTNFMANMLRFYGIPETYQEYKNRLNKVQPKDLEKVYKEIQQNLKFKKIVVISKNPEIQKIKES